MIFFYYKNIILFVIFVSFWTEYNLDIVDLSYMSRSCCHTRSIFGYFFMIKDSRWSCFANKNDVNNICLFLYIHIAMDTTSATYAFATYIFKRKSTPDQNLASDFPFDCVKKIDGIPVKFQNTLHYINIFHGDIYSDDNSFGLAELGEIRIIFNPGHEIHKIVTIEEIYHYLIVIMKYLNDLKFDVYSGKFRLQTIIDYTPDQNHYISSLESKFLKEQITATSLISCKTDGDCCVCYESTLTKTQCGHELCFPCWTKIKRRKRGCPMCKRNIQKFNDPFIDSDYDEDNDLSDDDNEE